MTHAPSSNAALDRIAAAIESDGCAIEPAFLARSAAAQLRARARALDAAGALHEAGVGRGAARTVDAGIRGDRIHWLDARTADPAERQVLDALEGLRLALNGRLALGLFELELHYAIYPPGAGYAAHRDRFRDDDARVVSCVLYLNEGWRMEDGGALRLHLRGGGTHDVLPVTGTLVAFLSGRFVHEVLPATRERISVTGWLRRRA